MSMLVPILVLSGIGAVMGVGLAVASRVFAVEEDPRVEQIVDVLPGANCGACGYPGCSGFAKALAQKEGDITACAPGGNATVKLVAGILGVEAQEVVEKVALVKCAGTERVAPDRSRYVGPMDCKTAVMVTGGPKECRWGCIGLGSCAAVCQDDAIDFVNGIAYVIRDSCIACNRCVSECPRDLIEMVPKDRRVHVLCSSKDPGKVTKSVCKVGCIACKLCNRKDKTTFEMDGDLARVNYAEGKDVPAAALVCTPGTIWDMDAYELIPWLTDPEAREHLKKEQKAYKEAEKAKKKAEKEAKAKEAKEAKGDAEDGDKKAEKADKADTEKKPAKAEKADKAEKVAKKSEAGGGDTAEAGDAGADRAKAGDKPEGKAQ